MIKNNRISELLDQYSNQLRRMGIYLLVIAFVFAIGIKLIADRARVAPPDISQVEDIGLEVSKPEALDEDESEENLVPDIVEAEQPNEKPIQEPKPKLPLENSNLVEDTEAEDTKEDAGDEPTLHPEIPVNSPEAEIAVPVLTEKPVFSWPMQGEVLTPFGFAYSQTFGDYRFNPAIDIQGTAGTEVKAALEGKVIAVENNQYQRVIVEIDHGQGLISRYSHMSQSLVKTGDQVKKGQPIGQIGAPGLNKTNEGPLLHFQIKLGDEWLDPKDYLQ